MPDLRLNNGVLVMAEIKNAKFTETRIDEAFRAMAKLEQAVSELRSVLIAIRADALSPAPVEPPEQKEEP